MMSGVPLETCWAFNERWNNKFCYKVASCWLFLLNNYYHLLLAGVNRQTWSCLLYRFPAEISPFCDHRPNVYQRGNNLPYVTVKKLQQTVIFPEFSLPFIATYSHCQKRRCTQRMCLRYYYYYYYHHHHHHHQLI